MNGNRFAGVDGTTNALLLEHYGELPNYAWPGGYDMIYLTQGGDVLCGDCATKTVRANETSVFDNIAEGIAVQQAARWLCASDTIVACACGPSDEPTYCDDCMKELDA